MFQRAELTGQVIRWGDPEPLNGEHLRSAAAVWKRGEDGFWRTVNVPGPANAHAYPWPLLSRTFRKLHVVHWPPAHHEDT